MREQVRVSVQCGLHLLVPQPVSDGQRGEAQLDQQTGMRVPDIMQADALHFSVFSSPHHLMFKKGFGTGKYAVMLMEPVEPPCIGFQLIPQKLRYRYRADTLRRLGRRHNVPSAYVLIGFADVQRAFLKVDIDIFQGEKFAYTQAGIIQNQEPGPCLWLIRYFFKELFKLFRRPELHLVGVAFADAPGLSAGVLFQIVVPDCIIQDGGELVVDRLQIGFRIWFPVLVLVGDQAVLLLPDVGGRDLGDRELSEEGKQLFVDDVLLLHKGMFPEPVFHVLIVNPYKVLEGHGQIGLLGLQKVPLPLFGVPLQLEAPLLFLLSGPGVIGIIVFAVP